MAEPLSMTTKTMKPVVRFLAVALAALAVNSVRLAAADAAGAHPQEELLRVLTSDAPPQDKAITCKKLAIYGNKEAVPALAALLPDPQLSSWARIALEAIPGPEADAALRDALSKMQGRLLVGVINTLGVRRDAGAVGALTAKLRDADAAVASASAVALGQIGGRSAADALTLALGEARPEVRSAVAEGCVICAERFHAGGQAADALRLYDLVRQAEVPRQRVVEATRGAILARGNAGIPLLLEQLRSPDRARYTIGLRTARELAGREATEALLAELDRTVPVRQAALLLAVADRQDAMVLPKVLAMAQRGAGETRRTALELLERYGDPACVAVLLEAAAESDPDVSRIGKAGLARLEGAHVDADLQARLENASGRTRQALLELVRLRRIQAAMPLVVQSAGDADAAIRRAACDTLGALGDAPQAGDLARLLTRAQAGPIRADYERALVAICARAGKSCLAGVVPLTKHEEAGVRTAGLHALASIGGAEALAVVQGALGDRDDDVQDEAVGILATWPGNWPEDVAVGATLLDLAKTGRKPSHQIQGMRGYLQFVEESPKLNPAEKLGKIRDFLPVVTRPEEKRQVIAVVSSVGTVEALEMLVGLAQEPGVGEEASLAILKVATSNNLKGSPPEVRRKALQTAVEKSSNPATRTKAEEALKRIR